MTKRSWNEVPTTDTVLEAPLTEEGTLRLRAKANRAGCPPSQLLRQGIDRLADLAGKDPGRVLRRVREPSRLRGEGRPSRGGEKRPPALALRPARMAGLIESARAVGEIAEQEAKEKGLLLWKDCFVPGAAPGAGSGAGLGGRQPALIRRLVQAGARWAIESLQVTDIRTGKAPSGRGGQLFEKPPGEERGGRRVSLSITKEAKQEISRRARRFGWPASKLARLAVCDLIEHIERRPVEALRYVREEREYYQPPSQGQQYRYAYQIAVGLETRRLLKYAPLVLRYASEADASEGDAPERNGSPQGSPKRQGSPRPARQPRLTQKRVLQAAGRWAIESEDIGLPLLGAGRSG